MPGLDIFHHGEMLHQTIRCGHGTLDLQVTRADDVRACENDDAGRGLGVASGCKYSLWGVETLSGTCCRLLQEPSQSSAAEKWAKAGKFP